MSNYSEKLSKCGDEKGATLISSLINLDLIDEVRLMINRIVLGGGKGLFKDVKKPHTMKLVRAKALKSGKVGLTYSTRLR